MIEYAINKLTALLIKQDFEDKQNKSSAYVKKIDCYKDLIKFLKDLQREGMDFTDENSEQI